MGNMQLMAMVMWCSEGNLFFFFVSFSLSLLSKRGGKQWRLRGFILFFNLVLVIVVVFSLFLVPCLFFFFLSLSLF